MSFLLEETEAVVNPLRSAAHDARVRADVSRVSRKELEDNFLQLHDDSLLLKQHIHQQEDKIRKLGTKLLRLVKDRRRMERLAEGGLPPASSRRDSEKEDLLGEFQEKLRALEADNERLRQRLFVAERRRRLASAARSPRQRVSRKPDDASSPSPTPPRRARSLPGDERPPTAQPAASAYALLEEAREKNRNLENAVESQRRRIAQLEEEKNVTLQQQNKSELRSQINNNVTMIKLQKQLAERCDAMSELEERFLQLQESQQTQKACYDAAAAKMAELTSQLKDERAKGVELRTQLQTEQLVRAEMRQLRERVEEAEQERDLLKEHNDKLLSGMLDGRPSAEERHLERQVARLEAALQADLRDKETILEQVRAERDAGEKLREEKRQLEVQLVEERRRTERLRRRGDSPADDGRTLARATPEVRRRASVTVGVRTSLRTLSLFDADEKPNALRELRVDSKDEPCTRMSSKYTTHSRREMPASTLSISLGTTLGQLDNVTVRERESSISGVEYAAKSLQDIESQYTILQIRNTHCAPNPLGTHTQSHNCFPAHRGPLAGNSLAIVGETATVLRPSPTQHHKLLQLAVNCSSRPQSRGDNLGNRIDPTKRSPGRFPGSFPRSAGALGQSRTKWPGKPQAAAAAGSSSASATVISGRTFGGMAPKTRVPQEFPPPADSVTPAAVGDIYTETVQELEKVRRLLAAESRVSANLKAELESIHEKMERDKKWRARQPEARPQMLAGDDAWEHAEGSAGRAAEWERAAGGIDGAAARERAPKGAGHPATREDAPESCVRTTAREYAPLGAGHPAARERTAEDAGRSPSPPADKGENLVEFQIVGAALSPAALEVLGDPSPSTFCTYAFYLYELHATPVATGASPRYGFTSRYAVSANRRFLNYLRHGRLRVELHQALGLRGKTLASAALELRGLLRDGAAAGALPLLGSGGRDANFGRLDYWIKLRHPIEESDGAVDRSVIFFSSDQVAVEQALRVEVRGCEGLRSERAWPPSPYVVYKLLDFPDQPTSTARDTRRPRFGHVRTFALSPSGAQERRLASEALTFYVFDYKEPRTDAYLGKAAVPLAPLLSRGELAGTFDLRDSSGRHAGRIDVALEFSRNGDFPPEAEPSSPTPDETLGSRERRVTFRGAPSPDRRVAKKVTFPDAPPPDPQKPAEEGEEDEESSISEGQLVLTRRTSDPAEEARSLPLGGDAARGRHSPSDDEGDDVVRRRATQDSRRFRVEVASLSLDAESRLCADADVVRLFVEFAFLDMPTEETPVSLPKPPPGKSVSFNFSKVVPVDSKRRLLREVLGGLKPDMERIRFTVVSEPPEEQEQERDCEDVGVAYLKIGDLLSQADDVASLHLPVVDVIDGVSPLGVLAVSFEGVRTLRLIRDEADAEARSAGA
nr:protein fantom-like [Nerophis lumbriciformis]